MAHSHEIIVNDSTISLTFIGGLDGEQPKILWEDFTPKSILDSIYSFLQQKSLDTLKDTYSDNYTQDGMQLLFDIKSQSISKTVHLDNVWVPQLFRLTNIVNSTLPDSLKLNLAMPRKHEEE